MSYQGTETCHFGFEVRNEVKEKPYQAIETSSFGFYDLYKENIFLIILMFRS